MAGVGVVGMVGVVRPDMVLEPLLMVPDWLLAFELEPEAEIRSGTKGKTVGFLG